MAALEVLVLLLEQEVLKGQILYLVQLHLPVAVVAVQLMALLQINLREEAAVLGVGVDWDQPLLAVPELLVKEIMVAPEILVL
jgi:hypothetical protein